MTSFQPTSSHSRSHSNLLHNLRIRSQPSALIPSTYTSFTPSIISRLDRISTLGSYNSATEELVGHSGCVNALDWNQDGHLLATGSDDRTVILWEMGTDQYHSPNRNGVRSPSSPEERGIVERNGRGQIEQEDDPEKDCPKIGMGVKTVIETVSTRVKFRLPVMRCKRGIEAIKASRRAYLTHSSSPWILYFPSHLVRYLHFQFYFSGSQSQHLLNQVRTSILFHQTLHSSRRSSSQSLRSEFWFPDSKNFEIRLFSSGLLRRIRNMRQNLQMSSR